LILQMFIHLEGSLTRYWCSVKRFSDEEICVWVSSFFFSTDRRLILVGHWMEAGIPSWYQVSQWVLKVMVSIHVWTHSSKVSLVVIRTQLWSSDGWLRGEPGCNWKSLLDRSIESIACGVSVLNGHPWLP